MKLLIILTIFSSVVAMGQPVEVKDGKLELSRYEFIDAKNKSGEVLVLDELTPSSAVKNEDGVRIDLENTNLIDVQLDSGRILDVENLKDRINDVMRTDPGTSSGGGQI